MDNGNGSGIHIEVDNVQFSNLWSIYNMNPSFIIPSENIIIVV